MNKNTFGTTPAALCLFAKLSTIDSKPLNRAVGRRITNTNTQVAELVKCVENGYIKPSVVANSLRLMRLELVGEFYYDENYEVMNLCRNVQIGAIKAAMRLCFVQRKCEVIMKSPVQRCDDVTPSDDVSFCVERDFYSHIGGENVWVGSAMMDDNFAVTDSFVHLHQLSDIEPNMPKYLMEKSLARQARRGTIETTQSYDNKFSSMVTSLSKPKEVSAKKEFELKDILDWFKEAVPNPTDKNRAVQLGVNIEETAELIGSVVGGVFNDKVDYPNALFATIAALINDKGDYIKKDVDGISATAVNRKELLDALCDQIVTAIGLASMFDLDICKGLDRVNESNWSKFVDGKAIFNEQGKIAKGPNYKAPNLDGLY
jgi:hypothetical protein